MLSVCYNSLLDGGFLGAFLSFCLGAFVLPRLVMARGKSPFVCFVWGFLFHLDKSAVKTELGYSTYGGNKLEVYHRKLVKRDSTDLTLVTLSEMRPFIS